MHNKTACSPELPALYAVFAAPRFAQHSGAKMRSSPSTSHRRIYFALS